MKRKAPEIIDPPKVLAAEELAVVAAANFVDTALVIIGAAYPIVSGSFDVSTDCC